MSDQKLIATTNIEHDGKAIPAGTVLENFPGSDAELQALRNSGAIEDYREPRQVKFGARGKETVVNEGEENPDGGSASDDAGKGNADS